MREGLLLALGFTAVPVLSVLVIGFSVSVLQAATQIQEQTLSFVPKLCCVAALGVLFGASAIELLAAFAVQIFSAIAQGA